MAVHLSNAAFRDEKPLVSCEDSDFKNYMTKPQDEYQGRDLGFNVKTKCRLQCYIK